LLAWRDAGFRARDSRRSWLWIVVSMVAARSVAMAFNRVLDADIDGKNPRTASRHLPAGMLTRALRVGLHRVLWSLVFIFAASELNPLCQMLAPVALGIVMFYSFTKRFTAFSHLVLGFSLGIAPAAAWIAMRGRSTRAFVADRRGHACGRRDST
jgi:4-hydroxybenzoate polyprenyltransferase